MNIKYVIYLIISVFIVIYGLIVCVKQQLNFEGKLISGTYFFLEGNIAIAYGFFIISFGLYCIFIVLKDYFSLSQKKKKRKKR